jgi:Novel STAND NTPase 1
MNTPDQTSVAIPLPAAPYVGMRPFEENEQSIFFGRDRDATLLANKVFSARLTVLYGPSGIGKSSILRTLLVPNLEKEEARTIYFDDWRADEPTVTLKDRLIEEVRKLHIPDFGAGPPSLADLVRLLLSADVRTVVLVLDQFEEFFTHRHNLDPLCKELGAIVRTPDLDVRVLLSLREEHLASLEPFRSEILDLFQSTYQLKPLDEIAIREAIESPANLFEAKYEDEFVKQLIDDLRLQMPQTETGQRSSEVAAVDLPMLQLLCDELWKKGDKKTISLNLYQQLGGQKGILDRYLKEKMPRHWRQKELTAQLMEFLAPPDGHKMSFSAGFLASCTEQPEARVQTELDRLSDPEVRVLRSSRYGTADVRYELWHDSFIRIIAPWRDAVLRRGKVWRWSIGIVAGVIIFTFAAWYVDYRIVKSNTEGIMASQLSAEQKFDHVAQYLLWSRSGYYPVDILNNRFDRLEKLLKEHERKLPRWYGIEHSGLEFVTPPEPQEKCPLTVHYSSARDLNERAFTQTWQGIAKFLAEEKGIPVPLRLKLVKENTCPKEEIKLTGNNIQDLSFDDPTYENAAYIREKDLTPYGQEFLKKFKDEWIPDPQVKSGGPWWIVPRWSLPAWKASGETAIDGSGIPAFHLAVKLIRANDNRLLSIDAMKILLSRVAVQYPRTVAEALAVRGDWLPEDFQEILKRGDPLVGLPDLLDTLANYPEGSPTYIADQVLADLSSAQTSFPSPQFQGPHSKEFSLPLPTPDAVLQKLHWTYRATSIWLPDTEPQIRVNLGKDLFAALTTERFFTPELRERLGIIQDSMLRQFGIALPRISIRGPDFDIPPNAFRIEILNQDAENSLAKPVLVDKDGDVLNRLDAALSARTELYRPHFVDAELVQYELENHVNEGLRSWLAKHYSLTDLKLLLRALVNPSKEEIKARQSGLAAGTVAQPIMMPPERSIRQPVWLLASLVFWSEVDDPRLFSDMADDLRRTQRAIINRPPTGPQNPKVAGDMQAGVQALSQGSIAKAQVAFANAIKSDKEAAIESFLVLYPQELRQSLIRKFTDSRTNLRTLSVTQAERIELEDLLAEKDFDQNENVQTVRRLNLCLLASYPDFYRQAQHELISKILRQYGKPEEWPAAEAAWFGTNLLESFDPLIDETSIPQTGLGFLQNALPQLNTKDAVEVYRAVLAVCSKTGPNQWCWDLLPALAETRQDPQIKLELAWELADREVPADLRTAIKLTEQAEQKLSESSLSKEDRAKQADVLAFVRAKALVRLARMGEGDSQEAAETTLRRLLNSPILGSLAYEELAFFMRGRNNSGDVTALLQAGISKFPDSPELYAVKLMMLIGAGDQEGISKIALQALKKVKKNTSGKISPETQGFAYIAALGLLLTKSGAWENVAREFLQTDHPYVPYVAIMLASRLTGKRDKAEALEVIERRWVRAKPKTWSARLRQGDLTVWREMLIGYYLGNVQRNEIFGNLQDDQRFARSDLSHLPMPRRGMLCEAYFYEALLADAKGDKDWRHSSLEKTVLTDYRDYFEYTMAQFLLSQPVKQK